MQQRGFGTDINIVLLKLNIVGLIRVIGGCIILI